MAVAVTVANDATPSEPPDSKPLTVAVGAVRSIFTVTDTGSDTLPAVSEARTWRVCVPSADEGHRSVYSDQFPSPTFCSRYDLTAAGRRSP